MVRILHSLSLCWSIGKMSWFPSYYIISVNQRTYLGCFKFLFYSRWKSKRTTSGGFRIFSKGCINPRRLPTYFTNNCMKMKENGLGGGAGASLSPPCLHQLSWLLQLGNHLHFLLYLRTRRFMSLFTDSVTLGCQITSPNIGIHTY